MISLKEEKVKPTIRLQMLHDLTKGVGYAALNLAVEEMKG